MRKIGIFILSISVLMLSYCSPKNSSQIDLTNSSSNFGSRLKFDTAIDTIIKNYFKAANKYGKRSEEAYKMTIEKDNSNEIEIIIYSFVSHKTLNNIKPIGWYHSTYDTLLIYSALDKIGIYDSCAYEIQKKISTKLIPDSVIVQFDALAWKILLRSDSMIVYKSPSQWAKPNKLEPIKFIGTKN